MAQVVPSGAPQFLMRSSVNAFAEFPNLLVKQTRKGWFQECFGCDANTEFNISTIDMKNNNLFYATENSSCCIRFFCGGNRPFEITVTGGNSTNGPKIAKFERPFNCCPVSPCKCCCYQTVKVSDADNQHLGIIREQCWYCVPGFVVDTESGSPQYDIHMPTCCCGMCINVCAEGCCNCRVPFYIYASGTNDQKGKIVKIWGGLKKEILTDADTFEVSAVSIFIRSIWCITNEFRSISRWVHLRLWKRDYSAPLSC